MKDVNWATRAPLTVLIAISVLLGLICADKARAQTSIQSVLLEKKLLPVNGPLTGMSNLFFAPLEDKRFRYPAGWKHAEVSPLLENPACAPVSVIRYKINSGLTNYVVDTNADLDFSTEKSLEFRQAETLRVADFQVTVRPKSASAGPSRSVSYQIILSDDGYVYGRISEYRQGQIRIDDKSYQLRLTARNRNTPSFNLSGDSVCAIDIDGDGEFTSRWHLSKTGEILPNEQIELSSPFMLGQRKLGFVELDKAGAFLKIQPSVEEISISPGFRAPDFTLKGLEEEQYTLASLKGKIVLVEFWSVNCPVCRRVLPEVNTLIEKNRGADFVALAVAREENAEEIKANLREHQRSALIALYDRSAWQTFDRAIITPTYYLLDKQGVIRLAGSGGYSDQLKVIDQLIEQMRKG
jgi:peroxiredoxin